MTRSVKLAAPPPPLEAFSIEVSAGGRRILAGVSLALRPGKVVAVLGPNGAGKSTLVRALAGVLAPDHGEVRMAGEPLAALPRREIARRLAVVPQRVEVPEGVSVRDVVASGRAPHQNALLWPGPGDEALIDQALERCDLRALASRPVEQLSGGELRRVIVARALAQSTPILLLDEPTAHLDLRHALDLLTLVRREADERQVAVLIVVHDLPTASLFADEVVLLDQGEVAASGPVADVMRAGTLERVFAVSLAAVEVDGVTTFLPRKPNFRSKT